MSRSFCSWKDSSTC